jgi:hypothetical protein
MIEAKLDVLNNVSDSKYTKCLQELKIHNDIIMKQTQYVSRRVRILLAHRGILFSNTYTKLFQILLSSSS